MYLLFLSKYLTYAFIFESFKHNDVERAIEEQLYHRLILFLTNQQIYSFNVHFINTN